MLIQIPIIVTVYSVVESCVSHSLTAIAIAMPDSVTVSMGVETSGVFSVICLVSAEVRSYSESQSN